MAGGRSVPRKVEQTLADVHAQILFYANSGVVGPDGQPTVSLYLSCEVGDHATPASSEAEQYCTSASAHRG